MPKKHKGAAPTNRVTCQAGRSWNTRSGPTSPPSGTSRPASNGSLQSRGEIPRRRIARRDSSVQGSRAPRASCTGFRGSVWFPGKPRHASLCLRYVSQRQQKQLGIVFLQCRVHILFGLPRIAQTLNQTWLVVFAPFMTASRADPSNSSKPSFRQAGDARFGELRETGRARPRPRRNRTCSCPLC